MDQGRRAVGTVMVIDDSAIILRAARAALEKAGYQVVTRDQAMGTGAAIIREKPHLVLLDVDMPTMKGSDLVTMLRNHPRLRDVLVAYFSSQPEEALQRLVESTGADGYICKRADMRLLGVQVEALLRRGRLRSAAVG